MSLLDKSEFVGLEQVTHLATGGEAPWLRSHDQATARMGALKSGGMASREQLISTGMDDPLKMPYRPDASRLEAENPNFLGLFVLDNALAVHERLDRGAVLDHVLGLPGDLREGLVERGYPVITPASREERAGNVCFLEPHAQDLAERLARHGVLVWGGEGRIRVSTHVYNDRDDVHRLLDVLDSLRRREVRAGA